VKDSLRIHQLPLNQRDVTALFNLTPGVEGGGAPRVNGAKVGATEMLQDGVTMVDRFGGGVQRIRPGLDTVQEFRIETAGSNARYSHPATVQLFTKSGTNELHGSAFDTFRNNGAGLRARQRQDGNSPAFLNRNEFGASVGGPVYIPKVYNGKNRSFFFFAYEGLRQRTKVFQQDYVPTAQMWSGDFSQVIDNNNVRTHIYDPLTTNAQGIRTMFPGDIVPQARLSKIFGIFKSVTHAPTNGTNPFQDINMSTFYPRAENNDSYTVKGDQRFSEKDILWGRFTRGRNHVVQTGGRFGSPQETLTNGYGTLRGDNRVYSWALSETHTFSPVLMNEFLAVVNRSPNGQGTLADFTPWAEQLALPNPFGVTGWPSVYTGNDPWGWDSDNRKDQNMTAYQIEDNATWIKGRHTIQFGGMLRREQNNFRELQQAQGSHDFGGDWTALYDPKSNDVVSYTGVGLASMAVGVPTYLSNQYNRGFFYFQQWNAGLYVQDSWRVSNRLTLDLGVRWEKWSAYREKQNRLVNVDLNTFANKFEVITPAGNTMESLPGIPPSVLTSWKNRGMTWTTANAANFPANLVPAVNRDFGPRLGIAYRITDKTVLRGGYGRYFWTMPLSQILQTSRSNPPLNLRYENNVSQTPDGDGTLGLRTVPVPDMFVGKVTVNTQGVVTLPSSARAIMPWDVRDWKDDTLQSWQVVIEREVMKDTAVKLHYIGNHGSNLEQRFAVNSLESQYNYVARTGLQVPGRADLRRVNPNWSFDAANHTGYSNTHSAQAEIERLGFASVTMPIVGRAGFWCL
jgi:outer membrane receptor protein involved in Fe transport